jgi:hypothetical protein
MNRYKSKVAARMNQYNTMLELANDKTSTLYNSDGSHNRGAGHRAQFWNGYCYGHIARMCPEKSSISYPIFRAGMDFKTETGE